MKIDLSYYTVGKADILAVSDAVTLQEFLDWNTSLNGRDDIRLPWGDFVCDLEGYVVEEEDFNEQVFTNCSLKMQQLIYKLKKVQLDNEPDSSAQLVFEA